tara:strand:- start:1033 stop:1242 length:210 start_codon:yes stop_codon:yes gene_type:complete
MNRETALQRSIGLYISFTFYSFQYVSGEFPAKMKSGKPITNLKIQEWEFDSIIVNRREMQSDHFISEVN